MADPNRVGLGRRFVEDDRDAEYPMRLLMAGPPVKRKARKIWTLKHLLHQGREGTCVGHGAEAWMLSAPIMKKDPTTPPTAVDIYLGACLLDEFPQNDQGDLTFGTTVRAAFKWLQDRGNLTGSYNHATDVNTVADFLAGMDARGTYVGGPVVIGVNWYDSMFDVNAEGFVDVPVGAMVRGGHCVCLIGWDQARGAALGQNSWGTEFGFPDPKTGIKTGRFWMAGETLDRLLHEEGEAIAASERRIAKRPKAVPMEPAS